MSYFIGKFLYHLSIPVIFISLYMMFRVNDINIIFGAIVFWMCYLYFCMKYMIIEAKRK